MRWRFRPIPELVGLPLEEQQRFWSAAGRDRSKRSDLLVVGFTLFMVGCGAAILLTITAEWMPAWARWPLWGIIFVFGGMVVDLIIVSHYRRVVRRLRGG